MRLTTGLFAAGILSLSVASAWAFTRGKRFAHGGNYSFTDPNSKPTLIRKEDQDAGHDERPGLSAIRQSQRSLKIDHTILGVSIGLDDKWIKAPVTAGQCRRRDLDAHVQASFEASQRTYGSPRIHRDLVQPAGFPTCCVVSNPRKVDPTHRRRLTPRVILRRAPGAQATPRFEPEPPVPEPTVAPPAAARQRARRTASRRSRSRAPAAWLSPRSCLVCSASGCC